MMHPFGATLALVVVVVALTATATVAAVATTSTADAVPLGEGFAITRHHLQALQEILGKGSKMMDQGGGLLHGRRWLQESATTTTTTRECNQVISVTPKEMLTSLFTGLADALGGGDPTASALLQALVRTAARYDVVVSKICASCAEILQLYANDDNDDDLLDDGGLPNGFSTYCAPDKFHHEAVVSGALFQPYNATSDTFIPGVFPGALTGKLSNSSNFFVGSERWPLDFAADFLSLATTPEEIQNLVIGNLDVLLPAYTATTGVVTIMADYVGYGEDYRGTKSYGTKRAYQLSSAVLWLKAVKDIPTKTKGCATLQNSLSLYGFSEGGYNAVATAAAMNDLGVQVLSVFAGGAPFRQALSTKATIDAVSKGMYNPLLYYAFPLLMHAYSSTNPDQPNTGFDQDIVASEWRDTVFGWIDDGLPGYIVNGLLPNASPLGLIAEKVLNGALTAAEEGFESACTPEFAAAHPDLFMDKLCEAFEFNSLIETVEAAPYPVQLCHSPQDDVVDFGNLPNMTANPNLSLFDTFPVEGPHELSYVVCYLAFLLPYTRTGLNNVLESNVGVCPSALVETSSTRTTPGTCEEDENAEIFIRKPEEGRMTCTDLEEMNAETIAYHCQAIPRAQKRCRVTCDSCRAKDDACVNDNTKTFRKFAPEPISQTCQWLNKRTNTTVERLCHRFSNVRSTCPKTCGACDE